MRCWLCRFPPSLFSSVRSVGSGVGRSGWTTDSRLWALEKVGYGKLVLDSRKEAVTGRLALSTPGMEDRRCCWELEVVGVEERPVGASRSCSLVEERLGRPWDERGLDFVLEETAEDDDTFRSRSLSRSRSFSLMGRNMTWDKWARLRWRGRRELVERHK